VGIASVGVGSELTIIEISGENRIDSRIVAMVRLVLLILLIFL
jgi:hypothetical protein